MFRYAAALKKYVFDVLQRLRCDATKIQYLEMTLVLRKNKYFFAFFYGIGFANPILWKNKAFIRVLWHTEYKVFQF